MGTWSNRESWRNGFEENEGIGVCHVCAERKPLFANSKNFVECHDCWLLRFQCLDCKVNTRIIDEYYTLFDRVWLTANPACDGMLCIGCLETRLGRTLTSDDFRPEVPINMLEFNDSFPKSARLIDRLSRKNNWTIPL